MRTILEGLRVVDCSEGIAGAYCTKLLADAGADVVKVESPAGDPLRRWSASGGRPGGEDGALFRHLHASKRGVTAAIDTAGGRARFDRIARVADVVVESLPATTARAAFGAEVAGRTVVSISPYGRTGPRAGRPANEFVLQARAGSTGFRGFPGSPPLAAGGRLGEWAAGAWAAVGALAGWLAARADGRAHHVDVSVFECTVATFNAYEWLHAQLSDDPDAFEAAFEPTYEVPAVEEARDGFVGLSMLTPAQWAAFTEMIGRPDLGADPALARVLGRWPRRAEVGAAVRAWTSDRTVDEVLDAAARHRVPAAPVSTGASLPTVPQVVGRDLLRPGPGGDHLGPRPPFRVEGWPERPVGPAPAPGEADDDLDAVARDWDRPAIEPGVALDSLRVVDFSMIWAGPLVAQVLGALGAAVVKVEGPQRPDTIRVSTTRADPSQRSEHSWIYQGVNTGKRAVALDVRDGDGRVLAHELVRRADVVVENFSPRVFESFGLDGPGLRALGSTAVLVRMPAYGLEGPWRDRVGFTQTMEQVTGLAAMTGLPDGPPMMPRGPCDPIGGASACFAALLGLVGRTRAGGPVVVESNLFEASLNVAAEVVVEHSAYGREVPRTGNRSPVHAPQGVYATADGWLAVSVDSEPAWYGLLDWLGPSAAGLGGARAWDAAARRDRHDELDRILARALGGREADAAEDELAAAGVPAGVVVRPPAVVRDPQLRARRLFTRVRHPSVGGLDCPGPPFLLDGRRPPVRGPAPAFGEHTAEVLAELGCDAGHVAALAARGVVALGAP